MNLRGPTIAVAGTAAAVLLLCAVQAVVGATQVGITTDEPTHVLRAQSWLDNGWYVPPQTLEDGEPTDAPAATPYVYGPAFTGGAHAVNVLAGNEQRGEVSGDRSATAVRHVLLALLGILTALAVGATVWALTGSRLFGGWSAAALLAIPLWLGMSMFNVKDLPVATGYTLVTASLVITLAGTRPHPLSRPAAVAIGTSVGAGIVLAAGTRTAMWLPLLVALLCWAVVLRLRARADDYAADPLRTRAVAGGAIAGAVVVVALYPNAFSDPLALAVGSLTDSSSFPFDGSTLTFGRLLPGGDPPLWYLPAWILASIPLLLLGLAIGGAATWSRRGFAGVRSRESVGVFLRRRELAVLPVLLQALLLPLGAVLIGSSMYTGLRQHLYLVPAIAILAGLGGHALWRWAGARQARVSSWAAAGVLVVALAVPAVEQTLLFPYNYAYVTPLASVGGVNDRWETDYWWASSREALQRLPASAEPACSGDLVPRGRSSGRAATYACAFNPAVSAFYDERGDAAAAAVEPAEGRRWVLGRKRAGNAIPADCEVAEEVTRWLRGEDVIMSYVLLCGDDAAAPKGEPGEARRAKPLEP